MLNGWHIDDIQSLLLEPMTKLMMSVLSAVLSMIP